MTSLAEPAAVLLIFGVYLACTCRPNREFWISLGVVCDDKVAKAKELLGETDEGVATGGLHKVSHCPGLAAVLTRPDE